MCFILLELLELLHINIYALFPAFTWNTERKYYGLLYVFAWRCEIWDPTGVFIAYQRGLHTDSIACPRPTAKFSLHTQSCKRKFLKITNRLICRFFVYSSVSSIYMSLNNNRKLLTNELLNVDSGSSRCVFQEILTQSLVHLLIFDFAKAILYEMGRLLINNQLQGRWKYGRGLFWCSTKTVVWRDWGKWPLIWV
jgi:hypothetical protein